MEKKSFFGEEEDLKEVNLELGNPGYADLGQETHAQGESMVNEVDDAEKRWEKIQDEFFAKERNSFVVKTQNFVRKKFISDANLRQRVSDRVALFASSISRKKSVDDLEFDGLREQRGAVSRRIIDAKASSRLLACSHPDNPIIDRWIVREFKPAVSREKKPGFKSVTVAVDLTLCDSVCTGESLAELGLQC